MDAWRDAEARRAILFAILAAFSCCFDTRTFFFMLLSSLSARL